MGTNVVTRVSVFASGLANSGPIGQRIAVANGFQPAVAIAVENLQFFGYRYR